MKLSGNAAGALVVAVCGFVIPTVTFSNLNHRAYIRGDSGWQEGFWPLAYGAMLILVIACQIAAVLISLDIQSASERRLVRRLATAFAVLSFGVLFVP